MRTHLHRWLKSRFLLVFIAFPVVMAIVGPFGTYSEMSFAERLLYWTILCVGIGMLMVTVMLFVMKDPSRHGPGMAARIVLGSMLAAVPGSALVVLMYELMRDVPMDLSIPRLALLWAEVTFVGIVVSFVEVARARSMGGITAPEDGVKVPDEPGNAEPATVVPVTLLNDRLPKSFGRPADIISLSMQDHYVEITCTTGVDLQLMRLGDAIAELDGLDGLRIHRSHWVARAHLVDLRKDGHRCWAELSDGRELPVSQTYLDAVRASLDAAPTTGPRTQRPNGPNGARPSGP